MNETPRPDESYIRSPEYWNGHEPQDDCLPVKFRREEIPSLVQEIRLGKQGRRILKDFLALADKPPIRIFGQGELFDGSQYPEGTIICFEDERLIIDSKYLPKEIAANPYRKREFWGVVLGYEDEGVRKITLMRYRASSLGPYVIDSGSDKPVLQVGEVKHDKIQREDWHSEDLYRVRSLQLFQLGKGVREESKRRLTFPSFGSIFRKPHRQGA